MYGMRLRAISYSVVMLTISTGAFGQVGCEALKPTPPQNINVEASGKIDTTLRRFTGIQGQIEGSYREATNDVLKEYPSADRLFLWSRMLYLYCENIRQSSLSDAQKIAALNDIARRIDSPPPPQGEYLLDPPVLQFGMTKEQARILLRARKPRGFSEIDQTIAGLQAAAVGRSRESTPAGSKTTLLANANLFGLQGEGSYGFDQNDRLAWITVWNICARDYDSRYSEWKTHKDIGIDDAVECSQIAGLNEKLTTRFGMPISSDNDDRERGPLPSDSAICSELYNIGWATCSDHKSSRRVERSRFIGKDRITPIDLTVRTLRYSARLDGKDLFGTPSQVTKIRERKVAILTVSSPAGANPIKPVVTGIFYMFLN